MKTLRLLITIFSVVIFISCGSDDGPTEVADTESPTAPLNLTASNITQNSILLNMENHSELNGIQNTLSLKMEDRSNIMSLKMEFNSKWNVTQNKMSLKIDRYSKWNVI